MSFRRHGEIYREACRRCADAGRRAYSADAPTHPLDEFPTGYSSAGCAPAEPASASPAGNKLTMDGHSPAQPFSANGETLLSHLSHLRGPLRSGGATGESGAAKREPLGGRVPRARFGWVAPSRAGRTQTAIRRRAARTPGLAVAPRSRSARLSDAIVELPAGRSSDRRRVRSALPRGPRLEDPAGAQLEPATSGRQSPRAQRRSDPHLEAQDLAGH